MMEHHPVQYRLKIKKERGHSSDREDLEESIIKMRHAKAAHEALSGAIELKSQGWLGVFIWKHCGGRTPQEFATPARINMAKIATAKARIAARL